MKDFKEFLKEKHNIDIVNSEAMFQGVAASLITYANEYGEMLVREERERCLEIVDAVKLENRASPIIVKPDVVEFYQNAIDQTRLAIKEAITKLSQQQ